MAKVFVGTTANNAIDGGDPVLTLDSGLVEGAGSAVSANDLVIVTGCVPSGSGGSPGWPVGWTTIDSGQNAAGTGRHFVAYKKMGASPDASVTFTGDGNAASSVVASAVVISGADYDSSVTPTTATGTSTNPDPAAVTPNEDNSAVVAFGFSRTNDGSITPPTNYTELHDNVSNADTNDVGSASAWRDGRSGGVSEDPGAFTTWNSGSWRTVTFVLKDAVTGIDGSLSKTLGALVSDADAALDIVGALSRTLAAAILSGAIAVDINAELLRPLAALALDADADNAFLSVEATLAQALGAIAASGFIHKWDEQSSQSANWGAQGGSAGVWTQQSGGAGAWSNESGAAATWTEQSASSSNWSTQQ